MYNILNFCSCACCVGYPSRCQFWLSCLGPLVWSRSRNALRFCWKLLHVLLSFLCGQFLHRWWQSCSYSGRPSQPKHFIGARIPLAFWSASSAMLTNDRAWLASSIAMIAIVSVSCCSCVVGAQRKVKGSTTAGGAMCEWGETGF